MKDEELRICGLTAVRARFDRDPASITRLYFDAPTARRIAPLCKALAAARKIYRCVEPAELEKVAGTVHHGGIVAVVADAPDRIATAAEASLWAGRKESIVILDGIGNAHNLGAIARTAAFFGVPRLAIGSDAGSARPGESAYRVAEGGLEFVEVWTVVYIPPFLRALAAAGYDVVGAATLGGKSLSGRGRPGLRDPAAPWALVLGNEEHGLSAETAAACSRLVTIPGSGKIESLNVSAAAAVLLFDLISVRRGR
jgi:RNA methyltransferase, TrmH family